MADEMRIGVLSDTHGSSAAYAAALDALGNVDLILHAGDCSSDARIMAKRTGIPTQYVAGNCDYNKEDEEELELMLCGFKVLIVHGHHHGVKRSLDRLEEEAQKRDADICIFGHSHTASITRAGKCLYINPGSPHSPRMGGPSCAVLQLKRGSLPVAEILALGRLL